MRHKPKRQKIIKKQNLEIMKKLLITVVLALMPALFFGQSVFDKYDGPEEIATVIVNKKMFQMMGNIKNQESQQYLNLVKKLESLKVFRTTSKTITADMKATSDKYIKSAGLEELMRISESGQNIKIMVKSGNTETRVKELLMFIEGSGKGSETVLMSLTGDFDLNDISMLTENMNLPGGSQLNKAGKGKGPKGPK
jgi:hypothetical protein